MSKLTSEKINNVYSRRDVYEALRGIVDVTEREISYWMDLKIIIPDIANPSGQGKTRYHSIYNLIDFAVAKKLALTGMNLKTIKSVMQYLRSYERESIYRSPVDIRLIVTNPNTDDMRVYFEGTDHLPSSDPETLISRMATNLAIKEWAKEIKRELITVGEKFESLFVLNITPMIKKILGVTE